MTNLNDDFQALLGGARAGAYVLRESLKIVFVLADSTGFASKMQDHSALPTSLHHFRQDRLP